MPPTTNFHLKLILQRSFALSNSWASWRIILIVIAFILIVILFLGRRLALLVADVEHAAIGVLINSIEPTAAQRVVIERIVILCVVAEHPTGAKAIADQRTGIFFIASGDFHVELGQFRVLIQQVSRIKP